jgi:hypothetical protein
MSQPCCAATSASDRPCAARPLPGSDFCLFHDPAHQPALAQGRSKGGSTPRRIRRYPRILDYKYAAELLSELFIDALNDPAAYDPARLRALTGLSKVLLQAVGRPRNTYEIHDDRSEPAPDEDCLRRIYPPEPPELADLLAVDAEIEAALAAQNPAPPDSSQPPATAPVPPPTTLAPQPPASTPEPAAAPLGSNPASAQHQGAEQDEISSRACYEVGQPRPVIPPIPHSDPVASLIHEGSILVDPGFSPGTGEQDAEQDTNKLSTGAPATDPFSPADRGLPPPAGSAQSAPTPNSALPCLRVEDAETTTLTVPGIPILISYRHIPRPFE